MAKRIVVTHHGARAELDFSKVDREKLYGRKERLVVDPEGRPCTPAYLSSDGAALVPPGGLALLYADPDGNTVERSVLVSVDAEGRPAPRVGSTLDVEQPLEGPVPPSRVLDHTITGVYALEAEALPPDLAAALEAGQIFETRFVYREDTRAHALFLLRNEAGLFGLVGDPHGFEFVNQETVLTPSDDADEVEDLDFSMI